MNTSEQFYPNTLEYMAEVHDYIEKTKNILFEKIISIEKAKSKPGAGNPEKATESNTTFQLRLIK